MHQLNIPSTKDYELGYKIIYWPVNTNIKTIDQYNINDLIYIRLNTKDILHKSEVSDLLNNGLWDILKKSFLNVINKSIFYSYFDIDLSDFKIGASFGGPKKVDSFVVRPNSIKFKDLERGGFFNGEELPPEA